MMLISAMTLKSEFSIENCTSFCCTKDNHIDGVQINHEMISIQCSIDTNFSSLSLKIGAHDFFSLVFLGVMKSCQMTKTYLLVHNIIGEVMWHVTYYLSQWLLIASVRKIHTHTLVVI